MNVLSFSYCFPQGPGSTWGIFVYHRLAALASRVRLEVASPVPTFPVVTRLRGKPRPAKEVLGGLSVHRPAFFCFPGILKHLDGRLYGQGLRKWFEAFCREYWRPDLLDAHFVWPDGVGVARLAREFALPYVITLRGWLYEAMKNPAMLDQCIEALQGAAAVISVSRPMAETAVELGVPSERVHVIPNGVDTKLFRPRDRRQARQELGLPVEGRLLVTVAHLGPRKGHGELIRALPGLPEDVRLILVGGDPQGRANQRRWERLAAQLGVGDRLVMVGPQPHERIPLYFSAADAAVLASYREGCPNAVAESLAVGVPVVATAVGHVPAMVADGVNGRVIPPREVESLRAALTDVLTWPNDLEHITARATAMSWDEVAGRVHDIFRTASQAV